MNPLVGKTTGLAASVGKLADTGGVQGDTQHDGYCPPGRHSAPIDKYMGDSGVELQWDTVRRKSSAASVWCSVAGG